MSKLDGNSPVNCQTTYQSTPMSTIRIFCNSGCINIYVYIIYIYIYFIVYIWYCYIYFTSIGTLKSEQ